MLALYNFAFSKDNCDRLPSAGKPRIGVGMRTRSYSCVFAFIWFGVSVLIPVSACGQSSTAPNNEVATSTVVKNTDEVLIDLVAHKGRNPVLDLKPGDIALTDDGTAMTLSDLRLVRGDSTDKHLITLFFDRLDPSAATNAREVARKILKVIPTEGFSFAVFSIGARLDLLQGFSADRQQLQKAIDIATGDSISDRDQTAASTEKMLTDSLRSHSTEAATQEYGRIAERAELASLTQSQRILQNENITPSLAVLLALAQSQSVIRGRKLLVYFTAGLPNNTDTADSLRSITGAANRANVSIYVINHDPVDTKLMQGMMATQAMGAQSAFIRANPLPTGQAAQTPTPYGGGMIPMTNNNITREEGEGLNGKTDPLSLMAAETGGSHLYLEDNLKKPFRQAVADMKTYYEASYVPPRVDYDGKFHQVKVKALRHGLKLHSRAGYYAIPPALSVRASELPLMKTLSGSQLPIDVPFRADVIKLGELSTGNENALVVEVPILNLETHSDANTNLLSWHVLIASEVKDKSGVTVAQFSEDIPGHGALNLKDRLLSECTTMQRHLALAPGEYTLETAVLDRNSGKIGGQRSQFGVTASGSGPFLSDLVLVRRVDPYPYELDPLEPLRFQHGRVVPNVSASVVQGTKELSFFFLVQPESSSSEPATLEMEVFRNGSLLGQSPLQLPKSSDDAFPYMASLGTASLPAGDYDVRLSLSQNGRISQRESQFRIPGPELASVAGDKTDVLGQGSGALTLPTSGASMGVAPTRRQPLVITSLPADSVVRPSDDELNELIEGARQYAVKYAAKLPNFLCVEITDRSVDPSSDGRWRRKDSFAEALRFLNSKETRQTLEIDGHPSSEKRADMDGPLSLGEFGDLLSSVFQSGSKTEFHWKETAALAQNRVQVFEYKVDKRNNSMLLRDNSRQVYAGFHGRVYIDSSSMGVRRITMDADDLPVDFSIHSASVSIDYDYVPVGEHDYLMPVRGDIRVQRGRHEVDLNQVVFQDYRRFASQAKIVTAQ